MITFFASGILSEETNISSSGVFFHVCLYSFLSFYASLSQVSVCCHMIPASESQDEIT